MTVWRGYGSQTDQRMKELKGVKKIWVEKAPDKAFSLTLARTGVIEMSRKSACWVRAETLGWDGCRLSSTVVGQRRSLQTDERDLLMVCKRPGLPA